MQIPLFADPQFVDANGVGGLNAAMSAISGTALAIGSGLVAVPGVLNPEAMQYSFTGLVANGSLPPPWALVTSGGNVVSAHGTITGQNSNAFSVNFASFVPGSGSGIAYLACSGITIQQNPFPIPGPPPGHPSYNPNFVPTIGYATNVDSVAVFATSGVPDNLTIFQLLAVTLTAGSGSVQITQPEGQVRAGLYKTYPWMAVSGSALTTADAQSVIIPSANNQTFTLPRSFYSNGLSFTFFNSYATMTIAASGSDVIGGLFGNTSAPTFTIPPSGACSVFTTGNGIWELLSANPNFSPITVSGISSSGAGGQGGGYALVVFSTPFPGAPAVSITPYTVSSEIGSSEIAIWVMSDGYPTATEFLVGGVCWSALSPSGVGGWTPCPSGEVLFQWVATYPPV